MSITGTLDPTGAVLAAVEGLRPGYDPDADFTALGLDSLDKLALAAALEHRLGRAVPDDVIALATGPADLARRLTVAPHQAATSLITELPGRRPAAVLPAPTVPGAESAAAPAFGVGPGWIDPGVQAGRGTRLWHQAQIAADAEVGADCTLGKGCYIGSGARVGDRVKIGNHASVFGARIEDEAMICPGALLLEDPAPRAVGEHGQRKQSGEFLQTPVSIGRGATVGANATIAPGVRVGPYAMVGIGAVVLREVPAHAIVLGNPARQTGWACRCGARLDAHLHCVACARTYQQKESTVTAQIE